MRLVKKWNLQFTHVSRLKKLVLAITDEKINIFWSIAAEGMVKFCSWQEYNNAKLWQYFPQAKGSRKKIEAETSACDKYPRYQNLSLTYHWKTPLILLKEEQSPASHFSAGIQCLRSSRKQMWKTVKPNHTLPGYKLVLMSRQCQRLRLLARPPPNLSTI